MKRMSAFTLGDMVIEYYQSSESVEWYACTENAPRSDCFT